MAEESCDCLEQVKAELKANNTEIVQSLQINFKTGKGSASNPQILTRKVNSKSRQQALRILCTYCPFCGKKYPDDEEEKE